MAMKLESTLANGLIIDDDKNRWGRSIGGVKIFSPEYLKKIKFKIDNVLLAIPSASIKKRKET